ncbi:fungal-specific transcription factor domain-containing protein [Mariannaea sp. PMI_226]|nr:fungal-specific transcription factor domain-containing protein [Mariannaea sp. PMI_226]
MCYEVVDHTLCCDARPFLSSGDEYFVDCFSNPLECSCTQPQRPHSGCKEHQCCVRTVSLKKCRLADICCKDEMVKLHSYNQSALQRPHRPWRTYRTIIEFLFPTTGLPHLCDMPMSSRDALCDLVESGRRVIEAAEEVAQLNGSMSLLRRTSNPRRPVNIADELLCIRQKRAERRHCVFPPGPDSKLAKNTKSGRRRRQTRASSGTVIPPRRVSAPIHGTITGADVSVSEPSDQSADPIPLIEFSSNAPEDVSVPSGWPIQAQTTPGQASSSLVLGSTDDQQHNLHIVGPAATSDSQVLSDYLSSMPGATQGSRLIIAAPGNLSKPVLFTMVQKRPPGLDINRSRSAEKLEIIEKILEPFENDVIDLYFDKVNDSFPLLDETSFRKQYRENKDRISPALIAGLYAHSITFWDSSPILSRRQRPDRRFLWNLTSEATYSELHLSPGMSIIEAIILNVGGRPNTSLIGNGVLLGSAVSMAHSLGLHHNPMQWEIPESEKNLRIKIWWALWVHDKWTSLAHGTPPHISRTHFNVPKPTIHFLCDSESSRMKIKKASIFIDLVELTDVLDLILQHIYHVGPDEPRTTAHLELALNNWVESLKEDTRRVIIRGTGFEIPGTANLRLSYLTVRLVLERIELEEDKKRHDPQDSRLLNRYIQARRTCEEILILTQELKPEHLADFWLSSSAFSFLATVSFLLRCALETENSPSGLAQSGSLRIASDLISILRLHKDKHAWDVGDVCLAQHAEIVEKLLAMAPAEDPASDGTLDLQDFIMPDVSVIDHFFPSLWDPLQSAW